MPDIDDVNGNPAIETDEPLSIQEANEWAIEVRGEADPRKAAIERLKCAAAQRRERKPTNPLDVLKPDPSYKVGTFNAEAGAFNVESSDGKRLLGQSLSNGNVRDGQNVRCFFADNRQAVIDVKPKGRQIVLPQLNPQVKKEEAKENIKILFYVNSEVFPFTGFDTSLVERSWKELWVGGTWPVKKVYTVPEGYRLADAFIVNTGENENDYIIMGRLFLKQNIHQWIDVYNSALVTTALNSPAAIFFTIENGILNQKEFSQTFCPPFFWRYCGGGFFYSGGSGVGINTIDDTNTSPNGKGNWSKKYHFYNGWNLLQAFSGDSSSFLNFAVYRLAMFSPLIPNSSDYHLIQPDNYTPIIADSSISFSDRKIVFGIDFSSHWYFKDKNIKNQSLNTFYSVFSETDNSGNSPTQFGIMGFLGEVCVTPSKNFAIDYQVSNGYSDATAVNYSRGFLYEPLIVNNVENKTLCLKQFSGKPYYRRQVNNLICLSDEGESPTFKKITGIPELNNYSSLGGQFVFNNTVLSSKKPPVYNGVLTFFFSNYLSSAWNNTIQYLLPVYYYNGSSSLFSSYSLSINQSETNKEILYLKDFLLAFSNFTGLQVLPSDDIRKKTYTNPSELERCTYFKPLTSYIENNLYIPYGFIDTNNKFFGTQGLSYSEPEKTRALPLTSKAKLKVVELVLDEVTAEITVNPKVKSLPIYMVTPENTGKLTVALASANYWCKSKTEGEPMPAFTPTPSEVFTPTPAPTPSPSPAPTPSPTPSPTPGYGYA